MKRFLVVFLILAVAGGGLFAQSLTFSGLVWSGIGILLNDHEDFEDPYFGAYSGRENAAARADLNVNFLTEDGQAGFRFQLRGQAQRHRDNMHTNHTSLGDNGVWINFYEAWVRVFDLVEIRGGRLDFNGLFNPEGGVDNSFDNGGGAGMIATVNHPALPDLHARVGIFQDNLYNGRVLEDARYNLALRYNLPGTADIFFNLRQGARGAWGAGERAEQVDIGFGVRLYMLRDLGFTRMNVDFDFQNLLAPDDTMTLFRIGPRADFVMGDLQAGTRILLQHAIEGEDIKGYQPDFTFTAYARYLLMDGTVVPQLNFGINSGTSLRNVRESVPMRDGVPAAQAYGERYGSGNDDFRSNWDGVWKGDWNMLNAAGGRGFMQGAGNMVIGPSVQYRIGGRDSRALEFGYSLQVDLTEYEGSTSHLKTMNHLIYLDIRVAF